MGDWSWKQAVAEKILEMVNGGSSLEISLDDLYRHTEAFQKSFPRNRHVRPKLRQILQRLRDEGFLFFQGSGVYRVNEGYDEMIADPGVPGGLGVEVPETRKVLRNLRLRNTFLAKEIKKRYDRRRQIRRHSVPLGRKAYAEAHHPKTDRVTPFWPGRHWKHYRSLSKTPCDVRFRRGDHRSNDFFHPPQSQRDFFGKSSALR